MYDRKKDKRRLISKFGERDSIGYPCSMSSVRSPSIGALYEDVEMFFGAIFAWYGRLIAARPLVFMVPPIVLCSLMAVGLVNIRSQDRLDHLYTPLDGQMYQHQKYINRIFGGARYDDFYPEQLTGRGSSISIILQDKQHRPEDEKKELAQEVIKWLRTNVTIYKGNASYNYADICARRNGTCCILTETDQRLPVNNVDSTDRGVNESDSIKMTFYLRESQKDEDLINDWIEECLVKLDLFKLPNTTIIYSSSDSLDRILHKQIWNDLYLLPVTVGLMILYAIITGSGKNWVSTDTFLAQMGICSTLMAIVAAFGLLGFCNVPLPDVCVVMPFLVLGVGMDDMVLFLSGWRQTFCRSQIGDRLDGALRIVAISMTIMLITDCMMFSVGATCPFYALQLFCAYSGTAVFICYVNHLTFFCGCLILNAQRVKANRHCVTCTVTASETDLHEQGHGLIYTALCHGRNSHRKSDEKRLKCTIFPKWLYTRYLLSVTAKCLIGLSYVVYLFFSIKALLQIKVGFNYDDTIPKDSYLSRYTKANQHHFIDKGPVVTVIFDGNIPYYLEDSQISVLEAVDSLRDESINTFSNNYSNWLIDFQHFAQIHNYSISEQHDFIRILTSKFLIDFPQHQHNIRLSTENNTIISSRFYLYMHQVTAYDAQIDTLNNFNKIISNSSHSMSIFSPDFFNYEHHTSIIKNTILTLTVTIISMLLVSLMFLPHLIPVSCVMISMVSVVTGMLGFLQMWNVRLSVLQIIQTVIAIGLTVHFTVQVSHAFMVTTGRTRNERVSSALQRVSETIIQDVICLILGIIMLVLGHSYIFQTFFKSMLIAILLGAWHALVLLPTLLSFIGPRRTWKPKVYIAVSPSCRSMSSNFNPFRTSIRSHCSRLTSSSSKPEHDNIPEESPTEPGEVDATISKENYGSANLHIPSEKIKGVNSCSNGIDDTLAMVKEDEEI